MNICSLQISASGTILGLFNFHNRNWLVYYADISPMGSEAKQFIVVDSLSQQINSPPHTYLINLVAVLILSIMSSLSSLPSVEMFPFSPLFVHRITVIVSSIYLTRYNLLETLWCYNLAKLDHFRFSSIELFVPLLIFPHLPNYTSTILQEIDFFIPHFSKPGKAESSAFQPRI